MNFETNQHPLKTALTRQTHSSSHIFDVHYIFCIECIQRVFNTCIFTKHSEYELSTLAKRALRRVMFERSITCDFHALIFQGQNVTPMIDDMINTLFWTETQFSLFWSYGLESTESWAQNGCMKALDIMLVLDTTRAEYEERSTLFKICFERSSKIKLPFQNSQRIVSLPSFG